MIPAKTVAVSEMPELERLMLHRLCELDQLVRTGYDDFDFKRISRALTDFMPISSCRHSTSMSARTRSIATPSFEPAPQGLASGHPHHL